MLTSRLEVEKNKTAIVYFDKNDDFAKLIEKRGYRVYSAYKRCNFLLRYLRRTHFKLKLPFISVWFNEELNDLKDFNAIIIFDATLNDCFVKLIKKKFPDKRIIFWYWNPVSNSVEPRLLNDICEKWSYSPTDSNEYCLRTNTPFYFKELKAKEVVKYDIFFIGKDKGRLKSLLDIKKQFEEMILNVYFHITPTSRYMLKNKHIYKEPLPYDDVLKEIGKSKAILDFLSNPNDGLSLRPMESIFLKKKLITNSQLIVKYDFYSSENIFILGRDNLSQLPKFLNSPYKEIDEKIVLSYDFNCWIKRFSL